MICFIWSC